MRAPDLTRRMVLEAPVTVPDGAGGHVVTWVARGTLWAAPEAGAGREAAGFAAPLARVPWTIVLRGAPVGSSERPEAGMRLREGERLFRVLAVAERDPGGRFLECRAEEEGTA